MNPEEVRQFDAFWEHVRKAEMDIAVNGHKGCPPPDQLGDDWDEAFAAAYQAVRKFLRRLRKERLYIPPPGMPWRPKPYAADTAHQALMEFLNPPQEAYGHPGVLDTPEYLAIKAAAVEELRLRKDSRDQAEAEHVRVSPQSRTKAKLTMLLAVLTRHHFPSDQGEVTAPLLWHEIKKIIEQTTGKGWSQATISRYIRLLYKKGGMREYTQLCLSKAVVRKDGFLKKYEDGSISVDALVDDADDDPE